MLLPIFPPTQGPTKANFLLLLVSFLPLTHTHTHFGLQEENEGCLARRPQGIFVSPRQQDPCGPACRPSGLIAIPCQFSWSPVPRISPSCGQKRERNKKEAEAPRHRSRRRQRERGFRDGQIGKQNRKRNGEREDGHLQEERGWWKKVAKSKTDGVGRKIGLQERRETSQEESKRRVRDSELQAEKMKEKYGGSWAKERKDTHRHTHSYTNTVTHPESYTQSHTVIHMHTQSHTCSHIQPHTITHTYAHSHMHTHHHTHQGQAGEELEDTG